MDMRGLAHFIEDIRASTGNKRHEEMRVDEELAKIRAKFIDTVHMTVYERKKYVCKLMFISMLGYRITFGHMEAVRLMAGESASEKLIGYLALTVLLDESSELLTLTTHTVYRDLLSESNLSRVLALTAIANTGDKDFAEMMHSGVEQIVKNGSIDGHVRKKALITLLKVWERYPEITDVDGAVSVAAEMLLGNEVGVAMCAATFLIGCATNHHTSLSTSSLSLLSSHEHRESSANGPSAHHTSLLSLMENNHVMENIITRLHHIIVDKATDASYVYYGVPAPWLQVKLLRLLSFFPVPVAHQLREHVFVILRKVLRNTDKVMKDAQTQQKQRGTQNRVCAMNAVMSEVVGLAVKWDVGLKLLIECTTVISSFLNDKREANARYMGLSLLAKLSSVTTRGFDYQSFCKQYQQQVIVNLHDSDVSVRRQALRVLVAVCTVENAREVIKELRTTLPLVNNFSFKVNLVETIVALTQKFYGINGDESYYVETLIDVVFDAGDCCDNSIVFEIIRTIMRNPLIQKRMCAILFFKLKEHEPPSYSSGAHGHNTAIHHWKSTINNINNNNINNYSPTAEKHNTTKMAEQQRHYLSRVAQAHISASALQLAAFVLGECGFQIALNAECTPHEQLVLLRRYFAHTMTDSASQAIILTTLFKFYHVYDEAEVRLRICNILHLCTHCGMAEELRQRASEYLALIQNAPHHELDKLLEPLALDEFAPVARAAKFTEANAKVDMTKTTHNQTWMHSNNTEATEVNDTHEANANTTGNVSENEEKASLEKLLLDSVLHEFSTGDVESAVSESIRMHDAQQRHLREVLLAPQQEQNTYDKINIESNNSIYAKITQSAEMHIDNYTTSLNNVRGKKSPGKVLYENENIIVYCMSHFQLADARLVLSVEPAVPTLSNKKAIELSNVHVEVVSCDANLLVQVRERLNTVSTQMTTFKTIEVAARALDAFSTLPSISLSHALSPNIHKEDEANNTERTDGNMDGTCRSEFSCIMTLPIAATCFITPYETKNAIEQRELFTRISERMGVDAQLTFTINYEDKSLTNGNKNNNYRSTNNINGKQEEASELHDLVQLDKVISTLGMYAFRTEGYTGVRGIGAFASQRKELVQFTPVACELNVVATTSHNVSRSSHVDVTIYAKEKKLRDALGMMLKYAIASEPL